jgi:hypothetical protein
MGKLLFFLIFIYTFAYSEEDLQKLLPGTDLNTLSEVQKSNQFGVNIYKRVKNNKTQVIVLVAEAHIKSKTASDLGKKMVTDFNGDFGLEGLNIDNYFMGPYFRIFLHGLYNTIAYGLNAEHSTIYDAFDLAKKQNKAVVKLEQKHKADLLENATLFFITLNISRLAYDVSKSTIKVAIYTTQGLYLTFTAPAEAWAASKKLPLQSLKNLGESFKPAMHSCAMPLVWMGLMKPFKKEIVEEEKPKTTFEKVTDAGKKFTAYGFGTVFGLNAVGYFYPNFKVGLLGSRNDSMVDAMIEHLDEQEDPRPLLVIAGALHHKGFQELLRQQGFELVSRK